MVLPLKSAACSKERSEQEARGNAHKKHIQRKAECHNGDEIFAGNTGRGA